MEVSNERVRVVEGGDPVGQPVVLLHGWGGSAYNFRYLLPRLASHGKRVIAPDLRGHGMSDKPAAREGYTTTALVRQVLDLLDAIGVKRAMFVGHSMAGALVVDLLRSAPGLARGAVLLAPIGFSRVGRVALARALRTAEWGPERVPRWAVTLVLRRVYGVRSTWEQRDVDEFWAPLRTPESTAALLALIERFDWSIRDPQAGALGRVRILFGERDRLIPVARAMAQARRFAGAEVVMIPGAGHLLADEVPEDVVREVLAAGAPT